MSVSRREFLRGLAGAGAAMVAGCSPEASASEHSISYSILVDTSQCVGCRTCEVACRRWNTLRPESEPLDLSPRSWTVVKSREIEERGKAKQVYSKWQCMHCAYPSCATVCPVGALYKTEQGPVLYDENKCIGCRYCEIACPFSVPRFDWEKRRVGKCIFCIDRIVNGLEPACVEECPQRLFSFGNRQAVIAMAEEAQSKGAYIFGKEEAGGTSWIYTSDVPFNERGFPAVGRAGYPRYSTGVWYSQMATVVVGAAALGLYSHYLRRKNTEEEEGTEGEEA